MERSSVKSEAHVEMIIATARNPASQAVFHSRAQTRDNQIFQEGRDVVTVCEWTDRIYHNTQPEHIITNVVSGRKMRVQKYNFPDTVVWNPWQEKARDIPDFGDDEFPNMICVESGHVSSPVTLLPGTAFEASQILQVRVFYLPSGNAKSCLPAQLIVNVSS